MAQILVVDDEIGIRELLSEILREEGHDVMLAENAAAARARREAGRPDLVLLDIWMPDTDGITLLKEWAGDGQLTMPVIMMSGHATIDTAVEATRIGALDFLEKPIGMQKLLATVKQALEHGQRPATAELSLTAFPRSAPLKDLRRQLEQVAGASRAVLLRSVSGGLIELVAHTLHKPGKTWLNITLDTHPLSVEALRSASGGVIYVEELVRLGRLQQKNLLFAADRLDEFDLSLIVGTEADAGQLAGCGWDESLLARVFGGRLGLPALADVRDEIPEIAAHLLIRLVEAGEVPLRHFSTAARNALRQQRWLGGYLELKTVVKSIALASLESEICEDDVMQQVQTNGGEPIRSTLSPLHANTIDLPLREAREIFERHYFEYHLAKVGGNMTRLAENSGLERTHLYRKLKDLGIRTGKRGSDEG
jgi:two-component system, NtrC family, nitrogen regulation response regulator NtrX